LALAQCGDPSLAASQREVRYPAALRSRCDFVTPSPNPWAIEVKMLRMLGDNGALNDNMLKHILSPYPAHHSAVTDCEKLIASGIEARKGILIFGYDHDNWPMDPAIEAFEVLAERRVNLTRAVPATVSDLVHPILREGRVFAWEITPCTMPEPQRKAKLRGAP